MSNYFSYFPTVDHDLTNIGKSVKLTNILRRFKFRSKVTSRADVFYDYTIQAGDRPDTIAEKYYGNAKYAWLVLHFNDIMDPIFGFPIFYQDWERMLAGKYGSVAAAQAEVHEYRKIIRQEETLYNGKVIKEKYVVVDEETYNTISPTEKYTVTKYDYELELNEEKRKIRLLDKRYLKQVEDEVEDILRNGV
jgi:hypothetical protein